MVDARLMDGSRVNAIIPPLAVDGPLVSIRRFGTDKLMPQDLVDKQAMTQGMLELLQGAVKARLNIVVSGGTGSGKTTLLNGLSAFISPKERVVTIEDAAELQLKQPHLARLETRPPNIEGGGAVRQRELLINALRMRPDRIIVGECRANSPRDVISRLEVMVTMANSNLNLVSIRHQVSSAIDLIVQTSRLSDGTRKVMAITEVGGMEGETVTLQDLFVFEKRGISREGGVQGRFAATGIRPRFSERMMAAGILLPGDLFESVVEIQ
jgi:pilus assembly protein CpaF